MHPIFEVKHSIDEPRILLLTTQTPRIGDDKLKRGNIHVDSQNTASWKEFNLDPLPPPPTSRQKKVICIYLKLE